MRFSKQTGCFHPGDIHYPELPADLIDISQSDYDAAMAREPGDSLDVIDGRLVVVQHQPTLIDFQATAVSRIKSKSGEVILARLPAWKQANLTARALELLASGDTAAPEWAAIQAQWTWVKSVRAASDLGELSVLAAQDQTEVEAALSSAISAIEAIQ